MKRLLLVSIIALAMLLAACGTAETPPPEAAPEPAPTSVPEPAPEPVPVPEPAPEPAPSPSAPAVARDGDIVQVHYKGSLEDGTVFDSSIGRDPLEFTLGSGDMIPGFENAVRGMEIGQRKTVTIPADEAYGPYLAENVLVLQRDQLAEGLEPEVGQQLQMITGQGVAKVVVIEVGEETVTVDANHPLAGKDLIFEIVLVGIS